MRALIATLTLSGTLLLSGLLAACGFQPLYGAGPNGGSAIGPVHVARIDGKAGHALKTELDRILAVEAGAGEPMQLEITLREAVVPLGLRLDESATRAELRLTAEYVLTPPNSGQEIHGTVYVVTNYNIPPASFSEITAQDDARERAAETLAQRFRAELALRLAQARSEPH